MLPQKIVDALQSVQDLKAAGDESLAAKKAAEVKLSEAQAGLTAAVEDLDRRGRELDQARIALEELVDAYFRIGAPPPE